MRKKIEEEPPKKIERRGGARVGAGRKPIVSDDRTMQVSLSIPIKTKKKLDQLKEMGVDMNAIIRLTIEKWATLKGIE